MLDVTFLRTSAALSRLNHVGGAIGMRRIQVQKTKKDSRWRDRWYEVLPIEPRDPDVLRAHRSSEKRKRAA